MHTFARSIESAGQTACLRQQLSHFGLNPAEWNIFSLRESSTHLEIEHREDPAFRLSVIVQKLACGFLRVDELSVVSL